MIANAGGLHELGFAARIVCRDCRPFELADVFLGAAMIWPKGKTHFPKTRAKIAAAKRGKTNIPELRGATDAQRADFKLFRAKGYSRQEAIALAMGATA